ncbi:hypothetical protein LMTR13_27200 [Bradyrhizobium icense]|uniref:DUF1376 domain-containing protein n=1 Tax=Bradyrhizobium icense TaxID=1274631 RepID=A0A1B1UKQ1_9BRAD|nr:hypothetical protein LMTR13_27200 [Bradyrhizobium icense]
MAARPWSPCYVGGYIRDTFAEQQGAHLLLLMAYWIKGGPLPDDTKFSRLLRKFPNGNGASPLAK